MVPLQFLLSQKSAYVSGQVMTVGAGKASIVADWKKPMAEQVAVVTGASRGIGEKIATTLARDGATVIGLDVPAAEQPLSAVMDKINGTQFHCT